MVVELSKEEIQMILFALTGTIYPTNSEKKAFELVMKLRDKLSGAT